MCYMRWRIFWAGTQRLPLCAACNEDAPSNYKMMKRWLLLAALAAAEDLAFVREGCRISIHGARAILRDGARDCDLWNAQSSGRRCASDRVLLCEVVFADQKAATSTHAALTADKKAVAATHAALTVATDAAYLAAPIPGGLQRYKYVEACVEINQCVGCTRQFFTKSFLGDDAAVLARSSGEEPASPRHRADVASMAWRTTR